VVAISRAAAHTMPARRIPRERTAELLAARSHRLRRPAGGFVLRFSKRLVAYLSGDTGITADQQMVGAYYSQLRLMSIAQSDMTGPQERLLMKWNTSSRHRCSPRM